MLITVMKIKCKEVPVNLTRALKSSKVIRKTLRLLKNLNE